MRRGIFGGTFDPVHLGHLSAVTAAAAALDLNVVHLVPAALQPLKRDRTLTAPEHRLRMLELAAQDDARLVVDDRELRRGGVSYSVDTVREINQTYPHDTLSFLIGADAAGQLDSWWKLDELAACAEIVVLTRPGFRAPASRQVARTLEVPAVDVSATDIRHRAARGESLDGMVPPAVAEYIGQHGLYQAGGE